MDDFFKMDVFFVATTAVTIAGGMLLIIALYYVIRILRNVDHIMQNVSEESTSIREDIAVLRKKVREEGMKWKHFGDFVASVASRNTKKEGRKKHTDI